MSDSLAKHGIYFDEVDRLCILDSDVEKHTNSLKEECKGYINKIDEFQRISFNLIEVIEKLAQEVEKHKMKSIGAQNMLMNMGKQKEAHLQQMQALISEKSMELERLKTELTALQKVEMEQTEIINSLVNV